MGEGWNLMRWKMNFITMQYITRYGSKASARAAIPWWLEQVPKQKVCCLKVGLPEREDRPVV
jgi:hypothetical protein